jgi:antirestriction protein
MERQQPNENEGESPGSNSPETTNENTTRIYVASLTDYNDGRLHGVWIDAAANPADLFASIDQMLDRSPSEHAEEFAIFDFEGFGPWRPGEYESIATVAVVARGIAEHGNAFGHWAAMLDNIGPDDLATFEDAYLGHWASTEDYAEDLFEGTGVDLENQLPEPLSYYVHVDYEAMARDMEMSGDITTSEGDGGVYIFEGHL